MKFWRGTSVVIAAVLCIVLVPFFLFEEQLTRWSTEALSARYGIAYGSLLAAFLLASDVVLPIPSSVISVLAGKVLGFLPAFCAIWLGMTASAVVGYFLGTKGTQILPNGMRGELVQLEHGLRNHGWLVIATSRSIPVLAEATVILAGAMRYDFWRFLLICSGSNFGISFLYAMLGSWVGVEGNLFYAVLAGILVPILTQILFRRAFI